MSRSNFESLGDILARAGAAYDAAEAHGTVCGVLCVGADGGDTWVKHLLDQATGANAQQQACQKELLAVRESTRKLLAAGALEFQPYLPDDNTGLKARTAALGEWCQGFLYGVGLGGRRLEDAELAAEVGEVLRDLAEIAKASFEGATTSEEDETDYAEILEYVRVGVQMIYEELQADVTGKPVPPSATLH